jgi:hypothetical protein
MFATEIQPGGSISAVNTYLIATPFPCFRHEIMDKILTAKIPIF